MIHKYVRPIRKKAKPKKQIRVEFCKTHYTLTLDSHKIRVSINDMRRLGDWIISHGKTNLGRKSEDH